MSFRCPRCGRDAGAQLVCPECGDVAVEYAVPLDEHRLGYAVSSSIGARVYRGSPLLAPVLQLALAAIVAFLIVLAGVWIDAMRRARALAGADAGDFAIVVLGVAAYLLLCMFCAFLFLYWSYRVLRNLDALGVEHEFRGRPLVFLLAWFVPVVNCVMPFMLMRDVWEASAPRPAGGGAASSRVVAAWWLSLLGGFWTFFSAGTAGVEVAGRQVDEFLEWYLALSVSLQLTAAALAIIMVHRIDRWQDMRYSASAASLVSPP